MALKITPPIYFFGFLVLMIGLHLFLPVERGMPALIQLVGIGLIAFGITINLITDQLFKKHTTTVRPTELPTTFLTSGPFKFSRNPMYLGMATILFGAAFVLGTMVSIIPGVLFVLVIDVFFIPVEEKNMKEVFGDTYRHYARRTRRWF